MMGYLIEMDFVKVLMMGCATQMGYLRALMKV